MKITAMAGGRPPSTSPRPPVLLQGAISALTKTIFIPCGIRMMFSVFSSLALCLIVFRVGFMAQDLTWSHSTELPTLSAGQATIWALPKNFDLYLGLAWAHLVINWDALRVAISASLLLYKIKRNFCKIFVFDSSISVSNNFVLEKLSSSQST